MARVGIIYLVWNDEPGKYLARALDAISAQTVAKDNLRLFIVYNPAPNCVSELPLVHSEVDKKKDKLPVTVILPQEKNLGFSGGNNVGVQAALDSGCDYIFLHNADGYLAPSALAEMMYALQSDKNIGQVQALVRLYPETDLINSAGNRFHFLGIGYCAHFRQPANSVSLAPVSDIGYASGAATMLRADLLREFGFWREEFYMYHEDTEYSLRLKINGYRVALASRAEFFHEYVFSKNLKKFYWIERNRHALKYLFFRWPTLILTWPLELGYNLGLLVVSAIGGWLPELLRAYFYWLNPGNRRPWRAMRFHNLQTRKLSDRQLLAQCAITVDSAELVVPLLIKFVANAVFKLYYYFLKLIIWW